MKPLEVAPDIAEASTLPSSFYKDPQMYERCKEAVFARSWQFVGDTDDLKAPGTVKPFVLLEGCLDEPLVVTRDYDDHLHLLSNVCTHRGMLVAETGDNARYLRCRYHGRRFGLDGCFQAMPEFEGVKDFPSPKDNLPRVSFERWGRDKFLFASLNPVAALSEVLKPVQERLGWLPFSEFYSEPSRARDYLVRANWALYCDNYLEGFHIPFIHASLSTAIDYGNYTSEIYDWCNLQLGVAASGETAFDLPKDSPDYGKRIGAYYYWVFPNLMLNFYPWGLSINVVRPLGPELTKVSFLPYVRDSGLLDSGAGAGLDRVEREDEVVVEAVQKGVKSRFYDRGRFSAAREGGVHHLHRLLARELG
ncbi:MAG: choline monooxygenase [Meiothermus sp.]